MARSSAGAEWVSAPMLMRSTPVWANARTVARFTPPEASSSNLRRRGIAPAHGLGHLLRLEVVDQDDVGGAAERTVELLERIDLDLDRRPAGVLARAAAIAAGIGSRASGPAAALSQAR